MCVERMKETLKKVQEHVEALEAQRRELQQQAEGLAKKLEEESRRIRLTHIRCRSKKTS